MHLHILGRQPTLGLAELEARYGAKLVKTVSTWHGTSRDKADRRLETIGRQCKNRQSAGKYS